MKKAKSLKKVLTALLALLMLAGFTVSCGEKPASTDGKEEEKKPEDTPSEEPPEEEDKEEEAVSFYQYESGRGTMIAPAIDVQTALNTNTTYSYLKIKAELKALQKIGFTRVYLVVATPGYGMATWTVSTGTGEKISGYTAILKSEENCKQDPNALYIKAAHECGMEAICVYKPYEGGGTYTVPKGTEKLDETLSNAWVDSLGGISYHADPLIAEHPEYRIERKPDYDLHSDKNVTAIEIDFLLNSYSAGSTIRQDHTVGENTVKKAALEYTLWKSTDNGTYTPISKAGQSVTFTPCTKATYDRNGFKIKDYSYVTVRIEGIDLSYGDAKYLAISFPDSSELSTIPYEGFRLYSGTTLLSNTVTSFVRKRASEKTWGIEESPVSGSTVSGLTVSGDTVTAVGAQNGVEKFNSTGFEFGWQYNGEYAWYAKSAVYGIARGTIEYIPGGLCEAIPEVREYWLSFIKKLLDYGADGIDIREWSHSTMAIDYRNYGFNQPIADAYFEKYGVDIRAAGAEVDFLKLALLRGDFFCDFLEEAADLTHTYEGAIFAVHVSGSYETPALSTNVCTVGHFTDPKLIPDYKRMVDLCDEVTVKDNTYSEYRSDVASAIKAYAHEKGKTVWVHSYLQQGMTDNQKYIAAADKDRANDGVILYEVTGNGTTLMNDVKNYMAAIDADRVPYNEKGEKIKK